MTRNPGRLGLPPVEAPGSWPGAAPSARASATLRESVPLPDPANIVVLAAADNVGIAVADIALESIARSLDGHRVAAAEAIPQGHKIALRAIEADAPIVRFGVPVGIATLPIAPGRLVHIHNVRSQYIDNDENHYE